MGYGWRVARRSATHSGDHDNCEHDGCREVRIWGRSFQRPTGRALERDEEKIRAWKHKGCVEIKKARTERRSIRGPPLWRSLAHQTESSVSRS